MRPEAYRGGPKAPDGSAWELLGERYDTNPRLLLDGWEAEMIRLWRLYQGSGFGPGHLPQRGGVLDQPVIMLEAFEIMSAAEAELKEKK